MKIQCKPACDVAKGKVGMHVAEALGTSGGTAPPVLKIGRRGRCVCHKRLGGTRVGVEDF